MSLTRKTATQHERQLCNRFILCQCVCFIPFRAISEGGSQQWAQAPLKQPVVCDLHLPCWLAGRGCVGPNQLADWPDW